MKNVSKLIKAAKRDNKILAVFLFGSLARENSHKQSDIDICLIMKQGAYSSFELSEKKLEYLKLFNLDVQIFQQLPIYIRIRIIKEGRELYCADADALYQLVFSAVSEFEDFKYIYHDYLREVESVR